ncbi:SGNH/GDSL hydrolase family protein [Paenibacillus chungangensis]|uniref:SGNH/GDSL hydrolase family protein n=1 Tax=Paenibacillus chungangensis TaxID=696535 RepID=A0ABW3HUB9_9BACL
MLITMEKLANGEHALIVCIGDSITEQNYHLHSKLNYVGQLTERLMEQYGRRSMVVNAGKSGHTTVELIERLERDALRFKPNLVMVMIGMNDSARVTIDDFRQNLQTIIHHIASSGSEVLLLTQNMLDYNVVEGAVTLRKDYPAYTAVIREVAADTGTPLCDLCAEWAAHVNGNTNTHLMLMNDSIHPNEHGHKLMASALYKYLGIAAE